MYSIERGYQPLRRTKAKAPKPANSKGSLASKGRAEGVAVPGTLMNSPLPPMPPGTRENSVKMELSENVGTPFRTEPTALAVSKVIDPAAVAARAAGLFGLPGAPGAPPAVSVVTWKSTVNVVALAAPSANTPATRALNKTFIMYSFYNFEITGQDCAWQCVKCALPDQTGARIAMPAAQ